MCPAPPRSMRLQSDPSWTSTHACASLSTMRVGMPRLCAVTRNANARCRHTPFSRQREVEVDVALAGRRLVGVGEAAEVLHQLVDGVARTHGARSRPRRRAHLRGVARDVVRQRRHDGKVAPRGVAHLAAERRARDGELHDQPRAHASRASPAPAGTSSSAPSRSTRNGQVVGPDAEPRAHDARARADAGDAHVRAGREVHDDVGVEGLVGRPGARGQRDCVRRVSRT